MPDTSQPSPLAEKAPPSPSSSRPVSTSPSPDLESQARNKNPQEEDGGKILESDIPDGGVQAWMVAIGVGCILFSGFGFSNSFGIFQAHYMLHQLSDRAPNDIAWIGSVQVFLTFATGSIAGPLFDRFGAWVRFSRCHYLVVPYPDPSSPCADLFTGL